MPDRRDQKIFERERRARGDRLLRLDNRILLTECHVVPLLKGMADKICNAEKGQTTACSLSPIQTHWIRKNNKDRNRRRHRQQVLLKEDRHRTVYATSGVEHCSAPPDGA